MAVHQGLVLPMVPRVFHLLAAEDCCCPHHTPEVEQNHLESESECKMHPSHAELDLEPKLGLLGGVHRRQSRSVEEAIQERGGEAKLGSWDWIQLLENPSVARREQRGWQGLLDAVWLRL